jgi:hypothetical protein
VEARFGSVLAGLHTVTATVLPLTELRPKIFAGLFIDLGKVLSWNSKPKQFGFSASDDGAVKINSIDATAKIKSESAWFEAFLHLLIIQVGDSAVSNNIRFIRLLDGVQYAHQQAQRFRMLTFSAALAYDSVHRQGNEGYAAPLSVVDHNTLLYARTIADKEDSPKSTSDEKVVCRAWNRDSCSKSGCVRAHVCAVCGLPHTWKTCQTAIKFFSAKPKARAPARSSPSPAKTPKGKAAKADAPFRGKKPARKGSDSD